MTVTNQRGIYSDHISAHIMAFVLAFARGLHLYMPQQLEGVWDLGRGSRPPPFICPRPRPSSSAPAASAARRRATWPTSACTSAPSTRGCPSRPRGSTSLHRPEALDEQIGRGDFVILTAPQTPAMEGLMNAERLARMKSTGVLINIGRGVNVVLDDLADALYDGTIGGAALDVFEIEPLPEGHRLWKAPNFLMTPHVAGAGPYLEDRRLQLLIENCRRLRDGEELVNVVDKKNWF